MASVDQGTTSAPALVHYPSQWATREGDRGVTVRNGIEAAGLFDAVPAGVVIIYKMTGWNAGTSGYESWISTGAPNRTPPSGHTLVGIFHVIVGGNSTN